MQMPNSIDDIVDMELEREYMGTATQFEQATVQTIGDQSQTIRGKSSGTEGQVQMCSAVYACLCMRVCVCVCFCL